MIRQGFAIWITGLPASGKSAIAAALTKELVRKGVFPLVLESDRMRRILTPEATYSEQERDRFYLQLVSLGEVASRTGVPVIFDATGNRKAYRDRARSAIKKFVEIFVSTPLDICISRDPKRIYASAQTGASTSVPGVQTPYERPDQPELSVDGTKPPEHNAERILALLEGLHYV